MASSDPISDSTPNKRRRLDKGGKAWDSQDDSGEEFTVNDFETVATMPISTTQRKQLDYTKEQFHSDLHTNNMNSYITQPTQAVATQAANPLERATLNTSDILVDRSSPVAASPQKPIPQPVRRAFAKPLGSAIAPPGTSYRAPAGIQQPRRPPSPPLIDLDSDDDPPVHHSSDDETQTTGFRSNLKPTNFKKGSEQVVKESPRPANGLDTFKNLLSDFNYSSSPAPSKPADDLISAYSNASRRPRPQQTREISALSRPNAVAYVNVDEIPDYNLRKKVLEIRDMLPHESVQRCFDALLKRKAHVQDAIDWLLQDEERDASGEDDVDELASISPVVRRGVAVPTLNTQLSSQPVRSAAKQEVKAPSRTIAEKYDRRPSQPVPKIDEPVSPEDEVVKPRKRLLQGRKPATRSPSPPSSPVARQRLTKHAASKIENEDDAKSDPAPEVIEIDEQPTNTESGRDRRLLKFFNDCSIKDLVDLSAQPKESVELVLNQRPFESLDAVRDVSTLTKTGKKTKGRPFGDKIVEICSEVWSGYDAVDELVDECERIAQPIQEALKGWGVGSGDDGELALVNLNRAHDSGIGTPASSATDEEGPTPRNIKGFLGQPENMNAQIPLKDYQLVGLNWLKLLWSKGISCILADDMGLGKTCQVIAFLAHLKLQKVVGTHLVIVPGSTLENWLREFGKFAPDLRVQPYYGHQDERRSLQVLIEDEIDSIDVVVTTYDMAQSQDDNRFLRHLDPLVCVYDEAHALRNPQSKRYKNLTRINARFKVLLTGTPLQNNLQELVAILAFLMPQMFVEKRDELQYIFQYKASTKDTDHTALLSAQRINRARSMITPFILRRKKHQVLDLPAKHNRVEYCDMLAAQSNYYQSLVKEFQQHVSEKSNATKARASSNMLMAVRKAAIHPLLARRLYDDKKIEKILDVLLKHDEFAGNDRQRTRDYLIGEHHQSFKGGDFGLHRFCDQRPYLSKFALKKKPWMDSGKVAKFSELIRAFATNGDRVLVFSQFTTMMDILEAVLETLDVKYMRLDGSTNMQIRQDMIDQFTGDESITVFMLSTKAGGAGINLACANKVVIFDSGFNPQDDIQAENRAHRVGQTREVEVVRLVTRNTIEEQIHALGVSKLALDERVQGEDVEDKQTEKAGEQMVEKMFLESIEKKEETAPVGDLKDAFAAGLQSAGVRVASKQARF